MRFRLGLAVGFGAGYYLGAKAGRERYEQMNRWINRAKESPREFDPRKFLKPAMDAMRDLCRDRLERFGTAGNASKIKVIAMDEMAKRYAAGKLDPQIATAKAA